MARLNSLPRLTIQMSFCSASASAFSIAESPAPTTRMVSSRNSFGIVQLVLDALVVFAGRAELAGIAFQADGEHHVRGLHGLAVGELQVEGMLVAGDLADLGAVADVDAALLHALAPAGQDLLAAAGAELEVAAQIQEARLRHDVLTLLVALDRLGVGVKSFQQHVAGRAALGDAIAIGRASGSAQPGRTRADDRDLIHAGTPAPAPALIP